MAVGPLDNLSRHPTAAPSALPIACLRLYFLDNPEPYGTAFSRVHTVLQMFSLLQYATATEKKKHAKNSCHILKELTHANVCSRERLSTFAGFWDSGTLRQVLLSPVVAVLRERLCRLGHLLYRILTMAGVSPVEYSACLAWLLSGYG